MSFTFSIKTLGCKLNQYESSLIASQLQNCGGFPIPFGQKADLVIINTCTVTDRSDKKCRNYIRQGAKFSGNGKVIVTGCMADSKGAFLKNMPEVSDIIINKDKDKITDIAEKYFLLITPKPVTNHLFDANYPRPFYRTRGLVKIQDGCDGECSYCIVPAVRGKPVSRKYTDIITHAKKLIHEGIPELILTGITIGKYISGNKSLADLVNDIQKIEGNYRIRLSSIEPLHVTDELIGILSGGKVCRHLHIPLQSGSDKILNLMNRPYSIKEYFNLIERIRKSNETIAVGTDIIIGYPGETDDDFNESLTAIDKVQFSNVHQFSFSSRKGTPASVMKNKPDSRIINERYKKMLETAGRAGENYRKKFIGHILPSIIERNKGRSGYTAVSDNYIKMIIDEQAENIQVGKISKIVLKSVNKNTNTGIITNK